MAVNYMDYQKHLKKRLKESIPLSKGFLIPCGRQKIADPGPKMANSMGPVCLKQSNA